MGNCCGITSKGMQQHYALPSDQTQQQFPPSVTDTTSTTETTNTPFLVTPDPMGLGIGSSSPSTSMPTSMTSQFVDERLLSLLEFFRQLHFRRKDIFKEIIPVHRKDFEDIFVRMDSIGEEEKEQHRLGGVLLPKSRSSDDLVTTDRSEDVKLERFKVKPINSPNDNVKGGGTGTKPSGSK